MAIAKYNKLPPRPEYIRKVESALKRGGAQSITNLILSTGLSKTQAACALDALIAGGRVKFDLSEKKFIFTLSE